MAAFKTREELANQLVSDPEYLDLPEAEQDALFNDLAGQIQKEEPTKKEPTMMTDPVGTVISSGKKYVGDIATAVTHPLETGKAVLDLGLAASPIGAIDRLRPGVQPTEAAVNAVGGLVKERYGGIPQALHTLNTDPVGAAADAALVLTGAGEALGAAKAGSMAAKVGGVVSKAGELVDPMQAMGKTVGLGARLASKTAEGSQATAARLVNSLIKPMAKDVSYGKNPGAVVAREGIVANTLEDLIPKISQRRNQLGAEIGQKLAPVTTTADYTHIINPLDVALKEAQQTPKTNSALIKRFKDAKSDIVGMAKGKLNALTPAEAAKIKTAIGDITKWTGNASDDKLVNAALKKSYGMTKQRINSIVPEVADLNEKYASLLSAESAAKYRNAANQRQVFIKGRGAIGGALIGFVGSGGQALPAILYGVTGEVLLDALSTTAVKTRVAKWLAKATPAQKASVFSQLPAFKTALTESGLLRASGKEDIPPSDQEAKGNQN